MSKCHIIISSISVKAELIVHVKYRVNLNNTTINALFINLYYRLMASIYIIINNNQKNRSITMFVIKLIRLLYSLSNIATVSQIYYQYYYIVYCRPI